MHVLQLLNPLLVTPNIEVVISRIPKRVPRPRLSVLWRDRAGILLRMMGSEKTHPVSPKNGETRVGHPLLFDRDHGILFTASVGLQDFFAQAK